MATSVKYDNTEILNTTYIPRFVQHESAPDRHIATGNIVSGDGEVIISHRYGSKRIMLSGILTAATESALETAIDNFKELFSRVGKNLDISWAGSTRRYVATCSRHNFNRDHFHLLFVPWTAEFLVPSGVGKATTPITLADGQSFGGSMPFGVIIGTVYGSAIAKPIYEIESVANATDPKGLSILNEDTGERIVFTRKDGFEAGKVLKIDCEAKEVTYDGGIVNFYGMFPNLLTGIGTDPNTLKIYVGEIVDQANERDESLSAANCKANWIPAQKFSVPHTDDTYQAIGWYGMKSELNEGSGIDVKIVADNGGKPDLANVIASVSFMASEIATTPPAWYKKATASAFTLEANTPYWIVFISSDASGFFPLMSQTPVYKRGYYSYSSDAGSTWNSFYNRDMLFRVFYGGKIDTTKSFKLTLKYYPTYL